MSFVVNILVGLLSGLISGYIVSVFYKNRTYYNKPKLKICSNLIKYKNDSIIVKIFNDTKRELFDLQIRLYGIKYKDIERKSQFRKLISMKEIVYLAPCDKKDKKCNYVHIAILTSVNNKNIQDEIYEYDELELFIKSIDYYHNTVGIEKKFFSKKNILDKNYKFQICECNASI